MHAVQSITMSTYRHDYPPAKVTEEATVGCVGVVKILLLRITLEWQSTFSAGILNWLTAATLSYPLANMPEHSQVCRPLLWLLA